MSRLISATRWVFDFDQIGPKIGQDQTCGRTRYDVAQLQDPRPFKGQPVHKMTLRSLAV
jgi:hypothetical protein